MYVSRITWLVTVSASCPAAGIENEEPRAARGELNVNWICMFQSEIFTTWRDSDKTCLPFGQQRQPAQKNARSIQKPSADVKNVRCKFVFIVEFLN